MKENIKKKNSKYSSAILLALRSVCVGGVFAFLFLNLINSQIISPLYFKLINGDRKSVVSYLQKIKNLTIFNKELSKSKSLFGKDIKNDVFRPDIERNNKIKEFEQVLQKNPQSKDILYGLYQLYLEKGDKNKAEEYLRQAKAVDPLVK